MAARKDARIDTTAGLAALVRRTIPRAADGIDPATRTFQALRIRVNDELAEIEAALAQAIALLAPGGRIVAVSFHSLEDRLVKRAFAAAAGRAAGPSRHDPAALLPNRAEAAAPRLRLLTPRPLVPGAAETEANPRARSARLRAAERPLSEGAAP